MTGVLFVLGLLWLAFSIPSALMFCAVAYFGGASRRPSLRHPDADAVKEKEDEHHV